MTLNEIAKYFDFQKRVTVETTDGDALTGVITAVENDFETESGVDEIELDVGGHYVGIEISDIKSIAIA